MGALAEFPDLVKSVFLTQSINDVGIQAVRFYIRGKPWVVTIDDSLYVDSDNKLFFAGLGESNTLWGPLLEKAWAKVRGSYASADKGGTFTTGIKALVGSPVYYYASTDYTGDQIYSMVTSANDVDYIMGAGTDGGDGSDQETNSCGIATSH